MRLIGIHGKARSGKDTVAEHLDLEHNFIHIKFADSLKMCVQAAFNLTEDEIADEKKEKINPFWGISYRKMLQFVGTEMFRSKMGEIIPGLGKNFWLQSIEKYIKHLEEHQKNPNILIVISDVRFDNEIQWVLNCPKSLLLHVKREAADGVVGITNHSSEADVDMTQFSAYQRRIYEVLNETTLGDLYTKVEQILDQAHFVVN